MGLVLSCNCIALLLEFRVCALLCIGFALRNQQLLATQLMEHIPSLMALPSIWQRDLCGSFPNLASFGATRNSGSVSFIFPYLYRYYTRFNGFKFF